MNVSPPRPKSGRLIRATPREAQKGFSLIECALALGVVSFAFVALVGLIPVGLSNFNSAIDATVGAQISQGLMTEVRQAKFSNLAAFNLNADPDPTKPTADYYFNEEGTRDDSKYNATNYVYSAAVQVFYTTNTNSLPIDIQPSTANGIAGKSNLAVIRIVVRRISTLGQSREYTGFVANNGL